MRVVGVLFLSLLPVLWGGDLYRTMHRRAHTLSDFTRFILFVREKIRYSARELDEIFSLALRQPPFAAPLYETLAHSRGKAEHLTERLLSVRGTGLKREDARLITEFYDGLGRDDTKGQLAHCDYYRERLERQADEARRCLKQKGRLTVSLALSGAAALFILMI